MYILFKVKTLVLDFASKIAKLKCNNKLNDDVLFDIKEEFVRNMLNVRDNDPSRLFINYDDQISLELARDIFKKIKISASQKYCPIIISGVNSYSVNIEGFKLNIPGVLFTTLAKHTEFTLLNYALYDTIETKRECVNLFVINSLLSLPIKKTQVTFVDLHGDYDAEMMLQNLPPSIYHNHPITSESQFEDFLNQMEKRKEEIISKYRDYPSWCQKNKQIPIPYELVVFYDDIYDKKYIERINKLVENGARIGVCILMVHRAVAASCNDQPYIFDPVKKELFVKEISDISNLTYSVMPHTGISYLGKARDKHERNLVLELQNLSDSDDAIIGQGDFEVWLDKDKHIDDHLFDQITSQLVKDKIVETPSHVLLGCFPTEEQACDFVENFCMVQVLPEFVGFGPIICLNTTSSGFWGNKATIELLISDKVDSLYADDLKFYFQQFGFSQELTNRIFGLYEGRCEPNENESFEPDGLLLKYWKEFSSKDEAEKYRKQLISHVNEQAIKIWGESFHYSHVHIYDGQPFDYYHSGWDGSMQYQDIHIRIQKSKHIAIPIEHYEIPKNDGIINFTPITSNETLLKACFDYIRTEAEAKEEMKVQTLDFDSAASSKYETDLSTMIIPVGKAESKDADFRMDLVSHVHSFIIGQSGSGKSVFLHNIIGGAMLKYAPEDLQLYLLDFKLGGVEFNRYQGARHVKALLVDNSDPQVTLEILRELRNSMTERGKLLRGAGVSNIGEYNKLHQQDRMPHVLVVADECHEMFKADDSIPRQVRNEISDIVIKIAKEGRSQGVHLVFATQTLSGTEISSEIINNVSDFYLLKCAQTDSERLVPNSSAITSELSTGQIYYHHVDEQVKFQAYYTDKEAAEKLMAAIVEKAIDHKSNGEFYFNGAQMFYLDESVKEQMLAVKGKSPLAFMGKAIDISQKDLYIKLNEDFSENVLLLGLNDQEQVTRTTMNLFVSLMMSAKLKHKDIAFKVIDCLNNEEGEVHELIFDLENEGYCDIIERRQRSKFFKELAQGVQNGTAEETILLILGQDRFRELKMDMELEESNSSKSSDDDDMMSISDDFFGDSSSSSTSVRSYRDALNVILEKGPDYGVHTLLQIEKASNLLFEDYITPKVVFQKFKHLVMLKSDETAGVTLHLNDDIRLEKLSSDWERLRAYYYAEESDSYTLFTPYMPSKSKDTINLLKTL